MFSLSTVVNLPNALTLLRILVFIPMSLWGIYDMNLMIALSGIVLGVISDFLDGFLARKLNQSKQFGALLDPLADKLFIFGIIGVVVLKSNISIANFWPTIVVNFLLMALGLLAGVEALRQRNHRMHLGSNWAGKIKFSLESIAVFGLAYLQFHAIFPLEYIYVVLWLSAVFGLISIAHHAKIYRDSKSSS